MKDFFVMLLIGFAGMGASAAPVVLDVSRSHTIEDLKRSGLRIKEIAGGLHGQAYLFQNQEVEIRLPVGRSINQNIVLGTIDTKEGNLSQLSMYGNVMPLEQAAQIARMFLQSFGLPLNELDVWEQRNLNRGLSSDGFSASPVLKYYPIIGIAVFSSQNTLYPWVVRFEIQWDWKEQRDWNEERAWRELSTPVISAISLNPPSRLQYDPRDAYKESLEAQAKFEKELAAKGQAATPKVAPRSSPTKATPSPTPVLSTPSFSSQTTNRHLLPVIIGLLALVSAFFIYIFRKK